MDHDTNERIVRGVSKLLRTKPEQIIESTQALIDQIAFLKKEIENVRGSTKK